MIAVGTFFLVRDIGLLPWVNDARIGLVGLEAFYSGYIVMHLVVIATGVRALHRTPTATARPTRAAQPRAGR